MMDPALLLPDFLLIALGWIICRRTALGRPVWEAAERLVYYLLFPVLLFTSTVKSPLQPGAALHLAIGGLVTISVGIVVAGLIGRVPGVDRRLHASGAQTAYRFSAFIALAMAQRLFGSEGLARMALLIALCVPLGNVAAVWQLARGGGQSYFGELVRNPLIISTVAGLLANAVGLVLPAVVDTTLQRIGQAALPVALMAVGAGLTVGGLKESPALASAFLAVRHALLPLVALGVGSALALSAPQHGVLVLFAAVPTASTSYVLTARMGGAAGFVAGLVMVSTLLGVLSIPLWLLVVQQLH